LKTTQLQTTLFPSWQFTTGSYGCPTSSYKMCISGLEISADLGGFEIS